VATPSNIFLVGLMGAGKTTVGKILAKHFDKSFYDTDHEIEKRTGVKIATIFELETEVGFRKRESAVIKDLSMQQNIVMATGGGAVIAEVNRQALKDNGVVIYLRADINELWQRLRHDKHRPLLKNVDIRQKITQLYAERDPLYTEVATFTIDTGKQAVSQVITKIEQALK
jgi:shikimate kinase